MDVAEFKRMKLDREMPFIQTLESSKPWLSSG
jgi:hypothetical protein